MHSVTKYCNLATHGLKIDPTMKRAKHVLKKCVANFLRFRTIWPYRPSIYVNLCTVNHDNSSCTSYDRVRGKRQPLPVMACTSSMYGLRDRDIGSVIGYRAKKDDIRSGLFVDLLHGGRCYGGKCSFKHLI